MQKYELTTDQIQFEGRTLSRIKALIPFETITQRLIVPGDLGGYVQGEHNLSHTGQSWISDDAKAYDQASVVDNAHISGNVQIFDYASISHASRALGHVKIFGSASVSNTSIVWDFAEIYGHALVSNNSRICGNVRIFDYARVSQNVFIRDSVRVRQSAEVFGRFQLTGHADIANMASIQSWQDLIVISPLEDNSMYLTFFQTKQNEIHFSYSDSVYSIQEFESFVSSFEPQKQHSFRIAQDLASAHLVRI